MTVFVAGRVAGEEGLTDAEVPLFQPLGLRGQWPFLSRVIFTIFYNECPRMPFLRLKMREISLLRVQFGYL